MKQSPTTPSDTIVDRFKVVAYTIGTILFIFAGWVWWVNNHYSFVYDNNFRTSCMTQGASETACGCALDVMKQNYSFATAKSIERTGEYPQALLQQVEASCQ